jgi:hypothetical protein
MRLVSEMETVPSLPTAMSLQKRRRSGGIFFLERFHLQVEGLQLGRRLPDIADRRKARPECFGLFVCENPKIPSVGWSSG